MMEAFKHKYQNFKIIFTFFLMWFSIQFGKLAEDSVAFVLIISLGILHGANDLLILSSGKGNGNRFKKYLLIYLAIIILCLVVYLASPFLAILLFILLSSYHFGEEHFSQIINVNKIFNLLFYTFYGIFLFSLLFYESVTDVNEIMTELTNITFTKHQIKISIIVSSVLLLLSSLYLIFIKQNELEDLLKEVFYLGLLFIVFKTSSLVLGFAIYFIFWHSIPSILGQVEFISGDLSKKSIFSYIKKAIIYWFISVFGLLALSQAIPSIHLFSIVFVVLFAVTAPHTWVMYKMKS